jgi:mycolipenoyl-CoA---2-(long-chain-fatty acyl)-trehalose mycolipenoyltransferase / long-chain-acyl-CoA---trehalose acyltransferase
MSANALGSKVCSMFAAAVTVIFPDNPVARQSVARYLEALKSVFERVAESGHWRNVA